ncbi:peptidyl-tRNA hydrolase [Atractiella rhizophila]|nr:peptidyl-tRNA hydrolase [Atractiella rhizophila]
MSHVKALRRELLVVGLGNHDYPFTRHSIGQLVLHSLPGYLQRQTSFERNGKLPGRLCSFPNLNLHLLQPLVPMNLSGRPIFRALSLLSLHPSSLVLLHDDMYLPAGKVAAKFGGSARGHNGVKDTVTSLKGFDFFWRIRVGIGKPPEGTTAADWVLGNIDTDARQQCSETGRSTAAVWGLLTKLDGKLHPSDNSSLIL